MEKIGKIISDDIQNFSPSSLNYCHNLEIGVCNWKYDESLHHHWLSLSSCFSTHPSLMHMHFVYSIVHNQWCTLLLVSDIKGEFNSCKRVKVTQTFNSLRGHHWIPLVLLLNRNHDPATSQPRDTTAHLNNNPFVRLIPIAGRCFQDSSILHNATGTHPAWCQPYSHQSPNAYYTVNHGFY